MNKTTYTNEEFKQVLQALLIEKKRVKKLENQLQDLMQNEPQIKKESTTPSSIEANEETRKLRQLVVGLKQKLAKSAVFKEPSEAEEEIQALKNQLVVLKERYLQLQKIVPNQEMVKQFEIEQETISDQNKQRIEELTSTMEMLLKEKDELSMALEENLQHAKQLEKGMQFLRERLEDSRLELENLNEELLNSFEVSKNLSSQLLAGQEAEEDLSKRFEKAQQEKSTALQELATVQSELEALKSEFSNNVESARDIVDLNERLMFVIQEKNTFEESLRIAQNQNEEREARFKIAQQHLAKKVKEVSMLTEKAEEQQNQVEDLEKDLNEAKLTIMEQQAKLENQFQQEKRLLDQLQETVRFTEGQIAKWEEKYFQVYEKWQEAEMRNRELKLVEDKHNQMNTLLMSLGAVIGSPLPFSPPAAQPPIMQPVAQPQVKPALSQMPSPPPSSPKNYTKIVDTQRLSQEAPAFTTINFSIPSNAVEGLKEEKEELAQEMSMSSPAKMELPPPPARFRHSHFD